jgi:hypothetical protein
MGLTPHPLFICGVGIAEKGMLKAVMKKFNRCIDKLKNNRSSRSSTQLSVVYGHEVTG